MTSRRFLLGAFVSAAALCVFATPGVTEEAPMHNAGAVSAADQANTTLSGDNATTTPATTSAHHEGVTPPPTPEHHDSAVGAHDATVPAGGAHHEADATRGGAEHHDAVVQPAAGDAHHTDAVHHEAGAAHHVDAAHTGAAHQGHHAHSHNPAFKGFIEKAQVSQETKDLVNEFMKHGSAKELHDMFDSEEFESHEVAERRQVIEEISATARTHNMYGFVKKAVNDAMTRLLQEYQMEVTEDNTEARGGAVAPAEAAPQAEGTPGAAPAEVVPPVEGAPAAVETVAVEEAVPAPAAAQ